MNFLNKEKDNIISIVKSLRPINYLYSKQNKDYDKFFRGSSLKGLIKSINSQPKYNEYLKPGESLEEMNSNKNNTIMDINFKSTFNYIEELSNLKNLPMVLLNKKLYKKGRYNNEHEDSKERKKKYKEKLKKEKSQRIEKIKNSGDIDVTLDPGRYHPNYNFIKRRYPCAYLGKPKPKEDSFSKELNQNEEKIKEKDKEQNINENNYDNSNNEGNKTDEEKNKTHKTRNKNNFIERISKKNRNKKMNSSTPNFYSMASLGKNNENKKYKIINDLRKNKEKSLFKFKDQNTVSSWTHTMDFDKSKKNYDNKISTNDKSKTNYNYYLSQRITNSTKYFNKNKNKLIKNSSADNLRCPIIFDKMPGRDRPINFVDARWEGCRTNYNPDYNIIRPHVRSTIFKSKRKYQNFKKYITGKIIRSYCYSPDQYFVFEIKENKENDISGKYGTIILKS